MRWEHRLLRVWYEGGIAALLLTPLSWIFRGVVRVRRALYLAGWLKAHRVACPVVVVGNITVGGTGKTPLIVWLAKQLPARGFRPGLVSRGYGGDSIDRPVIVTSDSDPRRVGDEPVLIARNTGMPVCVCRDRVAAAIALVERGADIILSDDGLQHYRLARDVELVVVDDRRGFGNGRLLPAGPMREPRSRLGEVDLVVRNGGAARDGEVSMSVRGDEVVNLATGERRSLMSLAGERWHAVAGIANPEAFFSALGEAGLQIERHPFNDHARLTPADIDFGDQTPVIMTGKDAVKCAAFAVSSLWYLPVEAMLHKEDARRLIDVVLNRCRKPAAEDR